MTDWRERRLGARSRPWGRRNSGPTPDSPPAPAPLVIAITFRKSAQAHADEALEALVALVRTASSEHVRVAAANAILDRALGKPLPGAKAAEDDADSDEDGEFEVRWLDSEEA